MIIIEDAINSFREGTSIEILTYFDSFDYCHPLLSEAGDLLLEEARERGIEIHGRSKADIARELFEPLTPKRDKESDR